ncbi:DUF1385 domain-containing protein [Thermotoga profunda]|uniref:DUF1385 domain-containing protein n=1 Tax=Thermotoga profunda TaxID=1508420 RepID=UPI0005977997|nr:DUF1385 domain-containing protein [Thermotoga profunda]
MKVGGQAIIEGVLMIGRNVSIAVRDNKGAIVVEEISKKTPSSSKLFKIAFLRGIISLYYSLYYGIYALDRSAEISSGQKMKRSETIFSLLLAVALAVGLFLVLPVFLTNLLKFLKDNEFMFSLVEGLIRLGLFLLYVYVISLLKDVKRIFQYHGAEHMVIHAYEANEELTVENVRKHSTIHPRCGTSFMMIFLIISIVVFSLLGSLISLGLTGKVISRIVLIPVVIGFSYEFLRISARGSKFIKILASPGLILQKLTTATPNDSQIEVAIAALRKAIDEERNTNCKKDSEGPEFFG